MKFSFCWNQALSVRLGVSSTVFSSVQFSLCYRFVTGAHNTGQPVAIKLALPQNCRQWRRDESKNSHESRVFSFHAFSAFSLTLI